MPWRRVVLYCFVKILSWRLSRKDGAELGCVERGRHQEGPVVNYEGRSAVLMSAVVFAFAGCGGAATTSAVPQNAMAQSRSHQMSGSSGDLLYVGAGVNRVYVLSYPEGKLVGRLSLSSRPGGLCSDTDGNVFVTEDSGAVVEYAHGGTSPINALGARGAVSCSWDPTTGNLAVVERPYSIAIFTDASGTATTYTDSSVREFNYCAYDDKGNLFITGQVNGPYQYALTELDTGSGSFKTITLNERVDFLDDLQWDGKYLAIDDFYYTGTIYRVQVSGSSGTIEASTSLGGAQFFGFWTWLQNGTFISPIDTGHDTDSLMDVWSYPSGGNPKKKLPHRVGNRRIWGVAVSVAPSRSQRR